MRKNAARALVVEANKQLAKALRAGLEQAGFLVDLAGDGSEADTLARNTKYELIVVDLLLPNSDGLALLRQWRRQGNRARVLVLKARDRAGVRRLEPELKEPILRVHDLEIDSEGKTVKRGGQSIYLTPREFALLQFLVAHRGRVVTRSMLREQFYDSINDGDEKPSNVVDVYIRYLRNKIDKGHSKPLIKTRWGQGYQMLGEGE